MFIYNSKYDRQSVEAHLESKHKYILDEIAKACHWTHNNFMH